MDIADLVGDNILHPRCGLTRTINAITKDYEMGDKGGKKDKEKSKKQNADKQEQKTKGKQPKPQSK